MPRRFLLGHTITPATKAAHRVRWFARFPGHSEDWLPRDRWMKGRDFGWDVKCSCGWHSSTGGGIEASVQEMVDEHRYDAQFLATTCLVMKGGKMCTRDKGHEGLHQGKNASNETVTWEGGEPYTGGLNGYGRL